MRLLQPAALCLLIAGVVTGVPAAETITVGAQEWTGNLDAATYRNGSAVPLASDDRVWRVAYKAGEPMSRYFADKPEMGSSLGRLYNWYAAANPAGLCPAGFRLPTNSDWQQLLDQVGGAAQAGKSLKARDGWGTHPDTGQPAGGSDGSGFGVVPAYQAKSQGGFTYMPAETLFWSADSSGDAASALLIGPGDGASFVTVTKAAGFSVRCVRGATQGAGAVAAPAAEPVEDDAETKLRQDAVRAFNTARVAGNAAAMELAIQQLRAAGGGADRVAELQRRLDKFIADNRSQASEEATATHGDTERDAALAAHLAAEREGIRLRALTCPGGEGKYYVTGMRPAVSPQVANCVAVDFEARCPETLMGRDHEGTFVNFVGGDSCVGDTLEIPQLSCPAEAVIVQVRDVRVCP